ncbi:MAG: universal stress protein [Planctomycetaceae bacterium]
MINLRKILVPTDFSEFSKHALRYGGEFARRFDAELHLLHVIDDSLTVPDPLMGAPVSDAEIRELQRAAETGMQKLSTESSLKDVRLAAPVVLTGSPFVEIVRHAKQSGIDLIVIGTHGRTGLAHVLLGSTAERVVRKARCPVLTVRPEGHDFVMP